MGFIHLAHEIIRDAERAGITARLFGGTAINRRLSDIGASGIRDSKDLDVVLPMSQLVPAARYLIQSGWEVDRRSIGLGPVHRIRTQRDGVHLDLFSDPLRFSQIISLGARLKLDPDTLTLADLLLTKLQVHDLTKTDLLDVGLLLGTFEFGRPTLETIDIQYVVSYCAHTWEMWYAACRTLREFLAVECATPSRGRQQASELLGLLADHPKSISWKMRAVIGERWRWYNYVDT